MAVRKAIRLRKKSCEFCRGYVYYRPNYDTVFCPTCNVLLMKNVDRGKIKEWF